MLPPHSLLFQTISPTFTPLIMTTCRYSVIPHIRIRPLYREHFSGEVTVPQNSLGPTNQPSSTHHLLPHFNHILPPTKSVFDYLLERQENLEIRGRCVSGLERAEAVASCLVMFGFSVGSSTGFLLVEHNNSNIIIISFLSSFRSFLVLTAPR